MVIVVVLIGVLLTVALPYFRSSTIRADVTGAMDAVSAVHAVAKATAIQRGRTTRLVMLHSSTYKILVIATKVTGTGVDTIGQVQDLGARFGVTYTTTRDTLTFTPRGIGLDLSGTTVIISKGAILDTLTISAAGRLSR
jgi:Tfp pilus assembly protein FimT